MGSKGGFEEIDVNMLKRLTSVPFVLVAPFRGKLPWWVLSNCSVDWAWADGELEGKHVQLLSNWIMSLREHPGIDEEWVSLLGFSAGAYAITEIMAARAANNYASGGALQPRSIVLGGVHGHGQPGLEGLDARRRAMQPKILAKWEAYLN